MANNKTRSSKNNGKKYDNKKSFSSKKFSPCDVEAAQNHPDDFKKYANLLADATAVNGFTRAIGRAPLPFEFDGAIKNRFATAGIMSATLAPIYTYPTSENNAINIAAKKMAALMRSKNTGSQTYDATDLEIYHIAGAEIISMLGWAQTALGLAKTYSTQNAYLPKDLFAALGWNGQDVQDNLMQFEMKINLAAHKIAAWNFFGDLEFIKKANQVYRPVLMDTANTDKTQLYCYRPSNFYVLWEDETDNANCLAPVGYVLEYNGGTLETTFMTVAQWNTIINTAIDALSSYTWTSIISGDIEKFTPDNIWKFSEVDLNNATPIIHDEYDLEQFMNLTINKVDLGILREYVNGGTAYNYLKMASGSVRPASGATPYGVVPIMYANSMSAYSDKRLVRTYRNSLEPADVVDLTVYSVTGDHSYTETGFDANSPYVEDRFTKVTAAGLYACTSVDVVTKATSNGVLGTSIFEMRDIIVNTREVEGTTTIESQLVTPTYAISQISEFKYAPVQFVVDLDQIWFGTTKQHDYEVEVVGAIDQFAFYDKEAMQNIAWVRNAIYFGL